jgi:hypothetical protein
MVGQVVPVTGIGMVGMGMGYYGIINGFPWVDVKPALGAVNAAIGKFKELLFGHGKRINRFGQNKFDCHRRFLATKEILLSVTPERLGHTTQQSMLKYRMQAG